jgi:hypothetical protein
MVALKWLRRIVLQPMSLRGSGASHRVLAPDVEKHAGRQVLTRRMSGDDPYWWILAGGTHVRGFGPYAEKKRENG